MSEDLDETAEAVRERLVQEREVIRADQDLQAIKAMEGASWFRAWWLRRLQEDHAKIEQSILSDCPIEQIPEKRAVLKFIKQLLSRPEDDKRACLDLLRVREEQMAQDD